MNKLDTISERKSWLDEEGSDGHLVEPTVEYPLKSSIIEIKTLCIVGEIVIVIVQTCNILFYQ